MRDDYEFSDVLEHSDVKRNTLMRWADAGIIQTKGGGSPGKRRQFTLRNLLEVQVCRELDGLGVDEPAMRVVVRSLNAILDQPDAPTNHRFPETTYGKAPILWFAFQRSDVGDSVTLYPVDPVDLISRLTTGDSDGSGIAESGIAIPIRRMIADLEASTGDTLR